MDDCIEACCTDRLGVATRRALITRPAGFMCFSSTDWCCFNQPCGLRGFRSPEYDEVGNGPRGVRGKGKDADAGDQMNRQPARAQGMLVDRKGGLAAGAQPPVVGRTSDQISRPSVAFEFISLGPTVSVPGAIPVSRGLPEGTCTRLGARASV
ncbi:hypothetical protein SCP_0505130 [Sparassis crispa]|uniref:Uncharacterized protein n=1 Tax=Sparassis crispa TaxID=139825 RepID=A0A401GNY8_9APHY|nr:hypothetical protein SCP_0505130 [Sparassis crispa]GBE83464.1 hypothetical protein SCP_0505130 [Sparassis crispa]